MTEEKKPTNYIQRLKEENEGMKKELEELKALKKELEEMNKPKGEVKVLPSVEAEPIKEESADDREEIVEVTYGQGALKPGNPQCVYKQKMPKQQAWDTLITFFMNNRVKAVPKEDYSALPVNKAVCYLKLIKRILIGPNVGEKITFYKEVPLWLAAERVINHPNYQIELVTKQEYDVYNQKLIEDEKAFSKPANVLKVKKAIEVLASQM